LSLTLVGSACGDDDATEPDDDCASSTATGQLAITITGAAQAAVTVRTDADGSRLRVTETGTHSLQAGLYHVSTQRVRASGALVGSAFKAMSWVPATYASAQQSDAIDIAYTREPGSERLWLTQSNGDGAQVMAFSAASSRVPVIKQRCQPSAGLDQRRTAADR